MAIHGRISKYNDDFPARSSSKNKEEMTMESKDSMLVKVWGSIVGLSIEDLKVLFDFLQKRGGKDGETYLKNFKLLLRKEIGEWVEPLLRWLGTTTTQTTLEPFIVKGKFRTEAKEGVKFSWVSENFSQWFLLGNGKLDLSGGRELRYGDLVHSSVDGPIIKELGGETKVETTLTELYDLLKRQANGEDGVLLNNSYANIFYIRDTFGVLRAVSAYWRDVGWLVYAYSVADPSAWVAGNRVFSRNS